MRAVTPHPFPPRERIQSAAVSSLARTSFWQHLLRWSKSFNPSFPCRNRGTLHMQQWWLFTYAKNVPVWGHQPTNQHQHNYRVVRTMFMFLHVNIHISFPVSYKKSNPSRCCSLAPRSRVCNDGQVHFCLSILDPCRYAPFRIRRDVVRRPIIRSAIRYELYALG